jgi:cysteine desulfurase
VRQPARIYLDHHATTPVDPRVLDAMLPYLSERFGNAASRSHEYGWEAREAVEKAREQVAALIGARSREIVFTSGATESDNLAIKGVVRAATGERQVVTVSTEHRAVLDACRRLEREGCRVAYLPVGHDGLIDLTELGDKVNASTTLVSVMTANNETGVIQPISEIGALASERGVLFHTDAVQAVGTLPFDVNALEVDLVSLTAHKIYGPKGVGALYVRRRQPRITLEPLLDGGGHEQGLRSGTLNVPGIVGFGRAAELARQEKADERARLATLRDRLHARLSLGVPELIVNGSMTARLPQNLNACFPGVDAASILMGLSGVAVSTGSACMSASPEPSYVLKAMGVADELARSSIRFGLGRFNTEKEIDDVADRLIALVSRLRDISPVARAADGSVPD